MADFGIDPTIPLGIKPTQNAPMTIADFLQLGRQAQAYGQSQALNPLQIELAKTQLETAKTGSEKARRTLEPEVARSKAEAESALAGSESARLKLLNDQMQKIASSQISMINNPLVIAAEQNPNAVNKDALTELVRSRGYKQAKDLGINERQASQLIQPYIDMAQNNPGGLRQYFKERHISGLDEAARTQALTPSGITVNTGAGGQTTATNPFGSVPVGEAIPGTQYRTQLAPGQVESLEEDATGNKVIVTRNPLGQVVSSRPIPGGQPGAPAAQTGYQSVPPGSSKEVFQVGPKQAINSYLGAINSLNNAESKATHIPSQEYVTKTLLNYLKDPDVNTGAIANVLSGKTKGESLSPKEQEVKKLLEQRIQSLAPRTDADAQSKKDAYGSFALKKPALIDIVRNDLGGITSQSLMAHGIVNAAGPDVKNPNLAGVNNFQREFSQFAADPVLMKYIGIIGQDKITSLDEQDKDALRKLFHENKLDSAEDKAKLEAKRKQLLQLISGAQ